MSPASDVEEALAGAENLQATVRKYFISKLPSFTMSEVADDLSGLVARFVLERQVQGLRSGVVLAGNSLGHLGLPLVRPACEERIWTAYLFSLVREQRNRLLFLMANFESSRSVDAQQQFLGSSEMKWLGFPRSFVKEAQRNRKSIEAELRSLGRALGWPPDARPLPSTGWVASAAKLGPLYDFLYSAASKGVHFSPSESLRSGWTRAPNEPVTLMAQPYVSYRTAFTIHWLSVMLVETLITMSEDSGPLAEVTLDDGAEAALLGAAAQIGSLGRLPIALAAEFNLEPDRPVALSRQPLRWS